MKYPQKTYVNLAALRKDYPERYYSIVQANGCRYRVYDAMGTLVTIAIIPLTP